MRLSDISLKVIWEKQLNKHLLPPPQAELEALAVKSTPAGASFLSSLRRKEWAWQWKRSVPSF